MSVFLIPVDFGPPKNAKIGTVKVRRRSVVLRPLNSRTTGYACVPNKRIPTSVLYSMAKEIEKLKGVSRVLLNLTDEGYESVRESL